MRMAAAQGRTNWFAIVISAIVVVVLVGLAGVVVWLNNQASAPGAAPVSSLVNEETGAISFGEGDTEVDTFVDFMCPICSDFEDAYGEMLQEGAANDEITLNIHPVSILDRFSQGTEFSTRAAASVYCVAEDAPDATLTYFNLLFANQPAENTPGLSDDELAGLAEQAGAAGAVSCIADGTYMKFVGDQTQAHEVQGTPTVEIDGKRLENSQIGTEFQKLFG